MPHTTTKSQRNKRPDTRPNEKQRRKMSRQIEDDKVVQEIRVTKKQRTERSERELPAGQTLKPPAGSVQDKVMRALRKKLRHIEELIQRKARGESLDEQQLKKIDSLDEVMVDLARYTEPKSEEEDSEEDEEDDE